MEFLGVRLSRRAGLWLFSLAIALGACSRDTRPTGGPADPDPPQPDASETLGDIGEADAAHTEDAGVREDAGVSTDANVPDAGHARTTPVFRFPIHADDRVKMSRVSIIGVDHDPAMHTGLGRINCRNHHDEGFPRCYDGHKGTDFMLEGGFATMDSGSARIVAAAGGVVVEVDDGNYDRCHVDFATQDVSCDGHPMMANFVAIEHHGGWRTRYYHMKSGSVRAAVGDRVTCGDVLGLVGSSGNSSGPHVHFEVRDPQGMHWDPYAGPRSQATTLWSEEAADDGLPAETCDPEWLGPPG